MQAGRCKLAAPPSLINSLVLINISTPVASATPSSVQRAVPRLLISLLGFWKGSWAVSNPHCLLMAEVRLCGAALPYESALCCACLALEDAVPVAGCVGLCCSLGWMLSLEQDVINVSLGAVCPKHQPLICHLCNRGRAVTWADELKEKLPNFCVVSWSSGRPALCLHGQRGRSCPVHPALDPKPGQPDCVARLFTANP